SQLGPLLPEPRWTPGLPRFLFRWIGFDSSAEPGFFAVPQAHHNRVNAIPVRSGLGNHDGERQAFVTARWEAQGSIRCVHGRGVMPELKAGRAVDAHVQFLYIGKLNLMRGGRWVVDLYDALDPRTYGVQIEPVDVKRIREPEFVRPNDVASALIHGRD